MGGEQAVDVGQQVAGQAQVDQSRYAAKRGLRSKIIIFFRRFSLAAIGPKLYAADSNSYLQIYCSFVKL